MCIRDRAITGRSAHRGGVAFWRDSPAATCFPRRAGAADADGNQQSGVPGVAGDAGSVGADGVRMSAVSYTHLHPDFVYCGMRQGIDLATHYASADLFLFPSLTETFGNVVLEAMAGGLAVAAFDRCV